MLSLPKRKPNEDGLRAHLFFLRKGIGALFSILFVPDQVRKVPHQSLSTQKGPPFSTQGHWAIGSFSNWLTSLDSHLKGTPQKTNRFGKAYVEKHGEMGKSTRRRHWTCASPAPATLWAGLRA